MTKNRIALILIALFCSTGLIGVGCKKKKKDPNIISKAEFQRRVRWGKPRCILFCKNMVKFCSKFLKNKKRKINQRKCAIKCTSKFIKHPRQLAPRIGCTTQAKTCQQLRNCNKCGRFICKPGKKGAKGKAVKGKVAPTARRAAPSAKRAAVPAARSKAPAARK